MARTLEAGQRRDLERGEIALMYRPRPKGFGSADLRDVQRLLVVLCPEGRRRYRVIAMGRKRPLAGGPDRLWGFVDLVLDSHQDLRAALAAQTYVTRARGIRHVPAARRAASGTYELIWHDDHSHLRYDLTHVHAEDPVVARELELESRGDFLVTVANPDTSVWGLDEPPPLQFELFEDAEVHVTIPTPFPPELQQQFGDRRFAPLDTVGYLDHPGTELVFLANRSRTPQASGVRPPDVADAWRAPEA